MVITLSMAVVSQVPCRWRVDASHDVLTKHPEEFRVIPSDTEGVLEVGGSARYAGSRTH